MVPAIEDRIRPEDTHKNLFNAGNEILQPCLQISLVGEKDGEIFP